MFLGHTRGKLNRGHFANFPIFSFSCCQLSSATCFLTVVSCVSHSWLQASVWGSWSTCRKPTGEASCWQVTLEPPADRWPCMCRRGSSVGCSLGNKRLTRRNNRVDAESSRSETCCVENKPAPSPNPQPTLIRPHTWRIKSCLPE